MVAVPAMPVAAATDPSPAMQNLPGKASARQVTDFTSNPDGLLKGNPIGGLQLGAAVKALTLADPDPVVDDLLNLLKTANSAQTAAIGSGLGQAIKAIQAVDKALADELAKKIAGSGSPELLAAYNLGTSDIQTFAVGGPGGGVGGGLGGAVGGTSTNSGTGSHSTAPGNFNTGNTASNVSFTGGSSVSCTRSVSPKRTC
jgi:hypothetical protein